jgi:hypothetical protein
MDTSFWNNLNKNIEFKNTKKQFFEKYLWRLEIKCELVDLSDLKYQDLQKEVELRRVLEKNRNYGGSWKTIKYGPTQFSNVDYVLIQSIRNIRTTYADIIKVRVESPWMQFYTESESDLQTIAQSLSDSKCIMGVTGPAEGTEQLLRDNVIIGGGKISQKYKVMLRDGSYPVSAKQQILSILEAQETSDIKITAGVRHTLTRPYPAMWGAFFYCNDLGITTILNLISPGIVSKVHEVVQL